MSNRTAVAIAMPSRLSSDSSNTLCIAAIRQLWSVLQVSTFDDSLSLIHHYVPHPSTPRALLVTRPDLSQG